MYDHFMEYEMPTRNDDLDKSEVLKVRISQLLRQRCQSAKKAGAHSDDAESSFLGYLIAIGIAKYENSILPEEIGNSNQIYRKAYKLIPIENNLPNSAKGNNPIDDEIEKELEKQDHDISSEIEGKASDSIIARKRQHG
jgi:hypothetical protein